MSEARALLKKDDFVRRLGPCQEVLVYICEVATKNNLNKEEKLTNTNIAKELYKEKYEELDKQFKTLVSELDEWSSKYKEHKKDFAERKKYPKQTVNRKCKKLVELELIEKNSYLKKSSDKRHTYYYPTQLGIEIYNIIKIEGLPILPNSKKGRKTTEPELISEKEIITKYKIIEHSKELMKIIKTLMKEFPEVSDSGIYYNKRKSRISAYEGEKFNVEKEKKLLYIDFLSNHLLPNETLLEKINDFKEKSKTFWENKNKLFNEILFDLEDFFDPEIHDCPEINPIDTEILTWIYKGAIYLESEDKKTFEREFLRINLSYKIKKSSLNRLYIRYKKEFKNIEIIEFSFGSQTFFRTLMKSHMNPKTSLEKKLSEYMNNLNQKYYFKDLIQNIKLKQEISKLQDEILEILERYKEMPVLPGDCIYINPKYDNSKNKY
jgi:hypothetical protein